MSSAKNANEFGTTATASDSILVVAALVMILAPFSPMPHVLEKLIMLWEGTLKRPIDIFDLFFLGTGNTPFLKADPGQEETTEGAWIHNVMLIPPKSY